MKSIKDQLSNYKIAEQEQSTLEEFQDYAIQVCKDFGISKRYQPIIFKQAKKNIQFLRGKVEYVKERFGQQIDDKGPYLISLFRRHGNTPVDN